MEDHVDQMYRIGSNNPAITVPASQIYDEPRLQRRSRKGEDVEIADPAGDQIEEAERHDFASSQDLTKYDVGWRRVVRNFSPSWFSITMGTGIVSLLLAAIPYQARWLYWLSVIFFASNAILFSLAFVVSFLRYTLYPEIWGVMIRDATNSLFLGTVPIGFATLVEAWISLCVPYWGPWATTFAWVMWMIDSVVAAAVTLSLGILIISSEYQTSLDRITAAQLLPIAATIVAAGAGGEVAKVLPNPQHALGTLVTSYVMWGAGVPLALTVLVMYYQRLALHKLPPREVIVSCFLPLGPLGMGGYTILYLGKVSRENFVQTHVLSDAAGEVVYVLGFFVGLILWGFGLVWLAFALATIYKCKTFPFNMGWWGFTFPIGVYALCTMSIGVEMPSQFFRIFGIILSVAVILLWIVVAFGTARGAYSGKLFNAPCVANLKPKEADGHSSLDTEKATQNQRGSLEVQSAIAIHSL